MSAATLGLGLHFVLELLALTALVSWGFQMGDHLLARLALGVGLPVLAAVIWAVLRVPNDPGPALIPVPGPLRLGIEWAILGAAAWVLAATGARGLAVGFLIAVVIDYLLMAPRVLWLWGQR